MGRIGGRDTAPEIRVRRQLHALGYRFRLHVRDLPGTPDIVLPTRKKAIFVHGCFWHRHAGCKRAKFPRSRREFWTKKLLKNVARDKRTIKQLHAMGWAVLVVWSCDLDGERLRRRLASFLGPTLGVRTGRISNRSIS
jgi:DNA mismatch endonuclease, patch repair protein